MSWKHGIDTSHPVWRDYRARLELLDNHVFPSPEILTKLFAGDLETRSGEQISFICSTQLPGDINYEQQISDTGRVATRQNSFHDLFNALAWSRFPRIKAAMNSVHCSEYASGSPQQRSKRRDALTLFDECGVVIVSADLDLQEQLARHQWHTAFRGSIEAWQQDHLVFVTGHALLEKYLDPYKAITAHALLIKSNAAVNYASRESFIPSLDDYVANAIISNEVLDTTHCLSAIPLAGIPGWWPVTPTDTDFYSDKNVFRPLGTKRPAAPVYSVSPDEFRVSED
jgi:hypothetical protein